MSKRLFALSCFTLLSIFCGTAVAQIFDLAETTVAPSPAEERFLQVPRAEKVLDFDVAKDGPRVAILLQKSGASANVAFWDMTKSEEPSRWEPPKGFSPRALSWHPSGKSIFLAGKQGAEYVILRADFDSGKWNAKRIYRSSREIRRLVPAPRPFEVERDFSGEEMKVKAAYRVFFGLKNPDGTWAVKSVTEEGGREYQAIGQERGFTKFKDAEAEPSLVAAKSALPLAFHPAGHILLWEDEKRDFQYALYARDHWEETVKLSCPGVSGGTLTPTPNGLGLLHWLPGKPGVTFVSGQGNKKDQLASGFTFLSTPSSVPDGGGIVGLTSKDGAQVLAYVPVRVPLADVANAWMFAEDQGDSGLFVRNGGLFRDLPDDQLYAMYESESYQCGAYDPSTPTRPYLVTTDVFWELLGAAYEGLFIVQEKQQAIPAFWEFVKEAEGYFRQSKPESGWLRVFAVLRAMREGPGDDEGVRSELEKIKAASGIEPSAILGEDARADFAELKPRGHYNSSEDMSVYFKAFKYLTELAPESLKLEDLEQAPPELKARARAWADSYAFFIAPPRGPVVWNEEARVPDYTKHPHEGRRLFPLSWGRDNEVLLATVYHETWPEPEQIKGPGGVRLTASGLDIASAFGSNFASALLATEFEKYPPLKRAIEDLRLRLAEKRGGDGVYNQWMSALALQWADEVASPGGRGDRDLWLTKRLQTGLASWATLRHATVLVNERTAAECGEGAFEPVLLSPPRGYVEPDPRTFEAIAKLFESLKDRVLSGSLSTNDTIQVDDSMEREALREGIVRRLSETAEKARMFGRMAEKQINGEPLPDAEYEEILLVGRVAEHHLLIFKSLASEDHALSNPDPMPKIADVAGGGPYKLPFVMAAVGRPMEWDHIVPHFGRRQIVKGAVYSYYEFISDNLMSDAEWLQLLPSKEHPSWVAPFVSRSLPACPPKNPF
ncbi:MAG: DUF3160 domain-containing protein [Desulfobacteraceae bacterium]|nr:DUF3160 domain-containing protein [Desulfobacteraceae bacterium]